METFAQVPPIPFADPVSIGLVPNSKSGRSLWEIKGPLPYKLPVRRITEWESLTFLRQDMIFARKVTGYNWPPPPESGHAITRFSNKSRQNLKLAVRNGRSLPYMVTLTYPREWPMDGRLVKAHWSNFRHWLLRRKVKGIWFLEFQRRGAPHFHILADKFIGKEMIANAWYRIVDSGDERHRRAGTRVEKFRHPEGAQRYATKYAIKNYQKEVPPGFEGVGRFWGRFGQAAIPKYTLFGERSTIAPLRRIIQKWAHQRAEYYRRDKGVVGQVYWGFSPARKTLIDLVAWWICQAGKFPMKKPHSAIWLKGETHTMIFQPGKKMRIVLDV